MRGVIVAAGEGKRMRPITYWRPKPLVPVGGQPLITHIIEGFARAGVRRICLVVGHLRDKMTQALGDGSAWGVQLTYVVQPEPTGTGAAVLLTRDFIADEPFLLSWGDILVPQNHYDRVLRAFQGNADGVLSVNRVDDPWEGAAVYVQEGTVTEIIEKPERGSSTTPYNNAGILLLPPRVLELTADLPPSPRGEVELPQAVAQLIAEGGRLRAVEVAGYWSDVARPSNVISMNGTVIQSREEQGLAIHETAELAEDVRIEPPVLVGLGVRAEAGCALGPNVALLADCRLEPGAVAQDCVLGPGVTVGANSRLRWVYAESTARVPPGSVLPGLPDDPVVLPPSQ